MRWIALAALLPLLGLLPAAAGATEGRSPNVTGVVVGLPAAGSCYPDEPCDPPAQPVLVFVRNGKVARMHVTKGRFAATLNPGLYSLRLVPSATGARVTPSTVRVRATGVARVTVRVSYPRATAVHRQTAATTGIRGAVSRGPISPVCRKGVPCSAPAKGLVLLFAQNGVEKARATTSTTGTFRVVLRPGIYVIQTLRRFPIGGIRARTVNVQNGRFTVVKLVLDTGIR